MSVFTGYTYMYLPSGALILKSIETHIQSYGFNISIQKKEKINTTDVLSAFLKANTLENFIRIGLNQQKRKFIMLMQYG